MDYVFNRIRIINTYAYVFVVESTQLGPSAQLSTITI